MAKRPSLWIPERAEIIFIEHSSHVSREVPGLRPMLVCSTAAFADKTGVVIGFPMTHAAFNADNPFALAINGPKDEVGYVLAFQPKSFDWRARNARPHPWGAGHSKLLAGALKKLDAICSVCDH